MRGGFKSHYLLHKSWCKQYDSKENRDNLNLYWYLMMVANIIEYVSTSDDMESEGIVKIYALNHIYFDFL